MKIWVYVEGESDRRALEALWEATGWVAQLKAARHGIKVLGLDGKSHFLRKLGYLAAEKLANNNLDRVVGLPDLYPNAEYSTTQYKHADLAELQQLQKRLVARGLQETQGIHGKAATAALDRFFPSALKHDVEMLLLAAEEELRATLRTPNALGNWRKPVEDQNQQQPPKRIVEELFRVKLKRAYRDTVDAPAVLRQVKDMRPILYSNAAINCPVFKDMLDYVGNATGVPAYDPTPP